MTSILTDNLTQNDLHVFQYKHIVRQCVKEGIDILYINDTAYYDSESKYKFPSKFILRTLSTLVKPIFLKGYSGNNLPQLLLDCCQKRLGN